MMLLMLYTAGITATLALVVRGLAAIFSMRTRRDVSRHPFLHAGVAVFALAFWLFPWGWPAGWISGHFDLLAHRLDLSHPPVDIPIKDRLAFSRIMRDRYGVFCPALRSCMVFSRNDTAFEKAHDAVVSLAISRRFGFDVFADCKQAADYETRK